MAGGPCVPAPSGNLYSSAGNPQIKAFRRLWNFATMPVCGSNQPERVSVRFPIFVSGMALATGVCRHQDWKTPAASAVPLTEEPGDARTPLGPLLEIPYRPRQILETLIPEVPVVAGPLTIPCNALCLNQRFIEPP